MMDLTISQFWRSSQPLSLSYGHRLTDLTILQFWWSSQPLPLRVTIYGLHHLSVLEWWNNKAHRLHISGWIFNEALPFFSRMHEWWNEQYISLFSGMFRRSSPPLFLLVCMNIGALLSGMMWGIIRTSTPKLRWKIRWKWKLRADLTLMLA